MLGQWAATNKATFLLCAFALENAIKAFLIYEHPAWISDGCLHHEICNMQALFRCRPLAKPFIFGKPE